MALEQLANTISNLGRMNLGGNSQNQADQLGDAMNSMTLGGNGQNQRAASGGATTYNITINIFCELRNDC